MEPRNATQKDSLASLRVGLQAVQIATCSFIRVDFPKRYFLREVTPEEKERRRKVRDARQAAVRAREENVRARMGDDRVDDMLAYEQAMQQAVVGAGAQLVGQIDPTGLAATMQAVGRFRGGAQRARERAALGSSGSSGSSRWGSGAVSRLGSPGSPGSVHSSGAGMGRTVQAVGQFRGGAQRARMNSAASGQGGSAGGVIRRPRSPGRASPGSSNLQSPGGN